jgi:signal transduction histidine kinase/anti-sigma regulatory factor (Ser/Thr protein kinase)
MGKRMNLSKSEQKIEKNIYSYPIFIALLTSFLFIAVTYNFLEEFEAKEKSILKQNLIEKEEEINFVKQQTNQELQKNLKQKIYEAIEIVNNIIKENPDKSKEELKKLVSIALSPMRFFNGRGYYLVYDKDNSSSVIHPVKRFIGKDMSKFRDKKGQLIVKVYDDIVEKSKEGFADIYFVKPNLKDNKEYKKIVFVKYIPELNWVIGTGDYFVDVEAEVQKKLLQRIERMRYGQNGYYWIHTTNHTLIMHPFRKDSIGKYDIDLEDSKGTKIIQMFVDEAQKNKNGTFVKYYWQKPNQTQMDEKIGFVKLIPEWDWVIGTGVYLDDINKLVVEHENIIHTKITELYTNIFMIFIIIIALATFLSVRLSKSTKKEFNNYSKQLISMNEILEKKVEERTKELHLINTSLEERIEAELNKNRVQELKLLEQSKFVQMGEMIGNIAHQWRQPLSVISVVSSGLQFKIQSDSFDKDDGVKQLETLNTNAQYLSETIDQFRDFIKEKREEKVIIVQERIDQVLDILDASFTNNFITIKKDINYEEPIKIKLVLGELSQIIINILNNAKDALLHKAEEDKWVAIKCIQKDGIAIISIEDNAGGIPDDIMPKIFDPYFTTKHQSQGTGIGLYMSKSIIEHNLKGKLYVTNTQNGARFVIEVPSNVD